jgi:hypothetical protein
MSAQSSGLAIRFSGRPKSEIPNGLGSEFIFGAYRIHLNDEDATNSSLA